MGRKLIRRWSLSDDDDFVSMVTDLAIMTMFGPEYFGEYCRCVRGDLCRLSADPMNLRQLAAPVHSAAKWAIVLRSFFYGIEESTEIAYDGLVASRVEHSDRLWRAASCWMTNRSKHL